MTDLISCCGLLCSKCEAFLATQANDDKMRAETAKNWSGKYKAVFKPEDINCEGCTTRKGKLFGYCHVCDIRKCAQENAVANCAHCPDYPCDKVKKVFSMEPSAKERLDKIKAGC